MPSFMRPDYGDPSHPEYERYMSLVKKGCPLCGNRLLSRGTKIGIVYCDDVHNCAREFLYDGKGGWYKGEDGKPGYINERFKHLKFTKWFKEHKKTFRWRRPSA